MRFSYKRLHIMYLEQKVTVMTWMFFYHTNQTFKDDSYSNPTKKKCTD